MNIKGISISQNHDHNNNNSNIILSINNNKISISPDIMAQSWEIYESKQFDQISVDRDSNDWVGAIYDYIIKNPDKNTVLLISSLLSI